MRWRLWLREEPALVLPTCLPTCAEVFHLAAVWKGRRLSAPLFAPDPDLLRRAHNKYHFIGPCRSLGLGALERFRRHLKEADELLDWPGDGAPHSTWRDRGAGRIAARHRPAAIRPAAVSKAERKLRQVEFTS
ncbi:hypothetical protein [Xanthobacter sediminis]